MSSTQPNATRLQDEVRLYEQTFTADRLNGRHLAPHALEMAATWAVLTRLEPMRTCGLTLLQKLRLYDGRVLPGMRSNEAERLREAELQAIKGGAAREGMFGMSSQFVQDCIDDALAANAAAACVSVTVVLYQVERGLQHRTPARHSEDVQHYRDLLGVVKQELAAIVEQEAKQAIAADEHAAQRLCAVWLEQVKAWTQREMIRNRSTGTWEEPDEELMRSIEEKIGIPHSRKDDFRAEVMMYIGALALEGKQFNYGSSERIQKALEQKLFDDAGGTANLTSVVSNAVDPSVLANRAAVHGRLMHRHGYCAVCATDTLKHAAAIIGREQ